MSLKVDGDHLWAMFGALPEKEGGRKEKVGAGEWATGAAALAEGWVATRLWSTGREKVGAGEWATGVVVLAEGWVATRLWSTGGKRLAQGNGQLGP